MAATQVSKISFNASATSVDDTYTGKGDVNHAMSIALAVSLANGVTSGQCNRQWSVSATGLATTTEVTFDLFAGVLDYRGNAINFDVIKILVVKNTSSAAEIQAGGGTGGNGLNAVDTWITSDTPGNAGSEAVIIEAGGALVLIWPKVGFAVTAGNDILRIYNNDGANTADYEIAVIGTDT